MKFLASDRFVFVLAETLELSGGGCINGRWQLTFASTQVIDEDL